MARIDIEDVAHRYTADAAWAVDALTHSFRDGSASAILGPSGCGKTTLLSILSGLLHPTRGTLRIDGREATGLPPRQRKIAQVFQFPVVYEAMTVFENLAFPLRNGGMAKDEVKTRVKATAELLGLTASLDRRASGLSADEQQIVSLGRGLIRPDTAALLLDEPLTVIDPLRRWEIRQKLRHVHQETNATLVYVTHDQTEALTFADEVVVMDQGRVMQVGTPRELFETPKHAFVGHFIGSPGMNFLPCRLAGRELLVDGHRLPVDRNAFTDPGSGELELGIRPEFLELAREEVDGALPVRIRSASALGDHHLVRVALGERPLQVRVPDGTPIPTECGFLRFPPEWIRLYRDGRLLT
ncbi:MAG: ABC transporter ATP-binding protein [Deltaproteobacteria bacterium]|nr:ABC transporter ATP-binding protein [Deltaproteobacteria bacterium]MBW2395285.1 ABC transporter ATP-binding protein [Deltaproteobacteria bacterium]